MSAWEGSNWQAQLEQQQAALMNQQAALSNQAAFDLHAREMQRAIRQNAKAYVMGLSNEEREVFLEECLVDYVLER